MAQVIYQYYEAGLNRNRGVINLATDTIKLALVTSSYVPSLNLHKVWKVTTEWQAATAYVLGDRVIPTTAAGYHYLCTTAGTSGATEPTWDTTEGDTTADGAGTLVWTTIVDVGYHEVADGDGYTTGGATLASKTLTRSGWKTTFDAADVTFNALTKTFRRGILYISGTKTDPDGGPDIVNPLYANVLFDDTPADIVVSGTDYVVQWSSLGISQFGPASEF
jgi:hypothetical protein